MSLPDLTMLDSLLLHLARLANGTSLSEAGKRLCRDAACCDDQSLRPYHMWPGIDSLHFLACARPPP